MDTCMSLSAPPSLSASCSFNMCYSLCVCVCVTTGSTLTADVLVHESVSATLLMSADLPDSSAPVLQKDGGGDNKGDYRNYRWRENFSVTARKLRCSQADRAKALKKARGRFYITVEASCFFEVYFPCTKVIQ